MRRFRDLCRPEAQLWLSVLASKLENLWRLLFEAKVRRIELLPVASG